MSHLIDIGRRVVHFILKNPVILYNIGELLAGKVSKWLSKKEKKATDKRR